MGNISLDPLLYQIAVSDAQALKRREAAELAAGLGDVDLGEHPVSDAEMESDAEIEDERADAADPMRDAAEGDAAEGDAAASKSREGEDQDKARHDDLLYDSTH